MCDPYVLTRFSFDLNKLLGSRFFFDPTSWEIHWTVSGYHSILSLIDIPYVYIKGRVPRSSEFSCRTVHLFSGTTLLLDRKFGSCRNSAFSRGEEISSVKGPRKTFYSIRVCTPNVQKVSSIDHVVDHRYYCNYRIYNINHRIYRVYLK